MIKVYRTAPTIKAEQFDGSDEMVARYELNRPIYLADGGTFGIKTLEGYLDIEVGEWIATGVNGEHWPIADNVFKQTYAELPVIPKYVAEYIDESKSKTDVIQAGIDAIEYSCGSIELTTWIEENGDTFARAWLDGYAVEGN